jgi:NAD(P)-dependent dehydrogenase (short-subunit alcohol dehydrogenase family)
MDLRDSTILVVGGSSGIGLASAHAAAKAGARVTIASRSDTKIKAALAQIGHDAQGRVLDTRDDAGVSAFFRDGAVYDHIVVSAAQTRGGPVRELTLDDAYASMNSKFWGAYRIARAAKIRDGGSLTLVSGYLAIRPKKGSVLQGAINAALEGLTRGLALEFAPVRVNAVSPGFVDTPLWGEKSEADHRAFLEKIAGGLPAGLAGEAWHIALQIDAFQRNPYITGSIVYLDGGGAIA